MLKNNAVYLLSNLASLHDLLVNNEMESLTKCSSCDFYQDKIAIQYCLKNDLHIIRIWKTKTLFDFWYTDFSKCGKNLIAVMDFYICPTMIKIKHLYVNDGNKESNYLYNYLLDDEEAEDLVKSLIIYIKKIASLYNVKKIMMDVHENLRIFEKYYYFLGFQLTSRRCKDNPFWIEVELNII